ncbi:hypothetical protein ebA1559 [Aromatoleum aromaticum EbN1]|uniref:Uncharacterized protein n=1 Tax=Aromatoleum aromaticum (strain DSM 19018 / LMG 30748 / EbN1) TaxID=76114 RepID=Q5P6T2_AROAE|nr:hypothetical protein ebA1559 [Aromatoleum aromaticum EbN1]
MTAGLELPPEFEPYLPSLLANEVAPFNHDTLNVTENDNYVGCPTAPGQGHQGVEVWLDAIQSRSTHRRLRRRATLAGPVSARHHDVQRLGRLRMKRGP